MRYLLFVATIALAGCNTAPAPPPVPRVPAVTLKPISDNNSVIKGQNATIRQQNTTLQAKVDAAIVAAHQAREEANAKEIDRQRLNTRLDTLDREQAAAKEQAVAQADTIGAQAQTIVRQDDTIVAKQGEVDNVKKIADRQSDRLDKANQRIADLELIEEEVNSYWGLGAYWYGTKRLGWHLLIVAAILAALSFVLNMFVPALQPIFAAAVKFFIAIPGRVLAFLKSILSKLWPKPPPPPT